MQSVSFPFGLLRLGMLTIELWLTQDYFVTYCSEGYFLKGLFLKVFMFGDYLKKIIFLKNLLRIGNNLKITLRKVVKSEWSRR